MARRSGQIKVGRAAGALRTFLRRHTGVHIWLAGVLALFAVYWWGRSSPAAANAVSGVTQRLKDGSARRR